MPKVHVVFVNTVITRMLENMLITLALTVARYFDEITSSSSGVLQQHTDTTVKNNTALELQLAALFSVGWGASDRRFLGAPKMPQPVPRYLHAVCRIIDVEVGLAVHPPLEVAAAVSPH